MNGDQNSDQNLMLYIHIFVTSGSVRITLRWPISRPECLNLKWWIFWFSLTVEGDTYYWLSRRCFSSERLLFIMSYVGGWWGALGVSAKRSPHLNVGYEWWWGPMPKCFNANRSPYLNVGRTSSNQHSRVTILYIYVHTKSVKMFMFKEVPLIEWH